MNGNALVRNTPGAQAWARTCKIVKGRDVTWPFDLAPPDAWRVFRHVFIHGVDLTRPEAMADEAISALNGYRHPRLILEIGYEVAKDATALQAAFWRRVVARCHAAGVLVGGPTFGSGAYEHPIWDWFRANDWFGFDVITFQAYWSHAKSFTPYNALRFRSYYDPLLDKRPALIVEAGEDTVRDGDGGTLVGKPGYRANGVNDEQMRGEMIAFDALCAENRVPVIWYEGGTTPDWANFENDTIAPFPGVALKWGPKIVKPQPKPQPKPTGGKKPVDTQHVDYPHAVWKGTPNFGYPTGSHGRQGHLPVGIVNHISEGRKDGIVGWFQNPASSDSSTYYVTFDGEVWQFVREADAPWTNGPFNNPDLSVPWIADAYHHGVNGNLPSITVELEGFTGTPLPETQYQALLDLHRDVFKRHGWPPELQRVVGHFQFDSVTRAHCPGDAFPWARLRADLGLR